MAQQVKSLATETEDLNLVPWTDKVEGENQVFQVVL